MNSYDLYPSISIWNVVCFFDPLNLFSNELLAFYNRMSGMRVGNRQIGQHEIILLFCSVLQMYCTYFLIIVFFLFNCFWTLLYFLMQHKGNNLRPAEVKLLATVANKLWYCNSFLSQFVFFFFFFFFFLN